MRYPALYQQAPVVITVTIIKWEQSQLEHFCVWLTWIFSVPLRYCAFKLCMGWLQVNLTQVYDHMGHHVSEIRFCVLQVQDDLTFKRKYRKRKNPSGGSQTSTAKTSAGEADGKKEQENKDEEKMETATPVAEKESKDDNEVIGSVEMSF